MRVIAINKNTLNTFLCLMPEGGTSNKKSGKIHLTNKYVCRFISEEWLSDGKSLREYGRMFGVNYHVIEKIMEKDGYNIPLSTLSTICFYKKIALSDFFRMIESKYGNILKDSYVTK